MAKAKTNGTVYAIEMKRNRWSYQGEVWSILSAIRPAASKEAIRMALRKYVEKRVDGWRTGPYRISTFKRTRSEGIDLEKLKA